MTTIETITDEQIEALKQEAAQAGDEKMVAICIHALCGGPSARGECVRVIREAEAA